MVTEEMMQEVEDGNLQKELRCFFCVDMVVFCLNRSKEVSFKQVLVGRLKRAINFFGMYVPLSTGTCFGHDFQPYT